MPNRTPPLVHRVAGAHRGNVTAAAFQPNKAPNERHQAGHDDDGAESLQHHPTHTHGWQLGRSGLLQPHPVERRVRIVRHPTHQHFVVIRGLILAGVTFVVGTVRFGNPVEVRNVRFSRLSGARIELLFDGF
uniref:(northern house mosquito) hypothetical protein n=1 Tax=Culex pipiens TaxID=7175 RepID=A0A8D8NEB5_CULPI